MYLLCVHEVCPQVAEDYRSTLLDALDAKMFGTVAEEADDLKAKVHVHLKMTQTGQDPGDMVPTKKVREALKPGKRNRPKSYEVLLHMESITKLMSGKKKGLVQFVVDPALPSALTWPRLTICSDRGSDLVSAVNFMKRKLKLNLEWRDDKLHAA